MHLGQDSILVYYNRITKLWSEYDDCRKKTICAHYLINEDERLLELPVGLNDNFVTIRGHILLMDPLPSLNTAYQLLIQEEDQRGAIVSNQDDTLLSSLFFSNPLDPLELKHPKTNYYAHIATNQAISKKSTIRCMVTLTSLPSVPSPNTDH